MSKDNIQTLLTNKSSQDAIQLANLVDQIYEVKEIEDILFDHKSRKIYQNLRNKGIRSVPSFVTEFIKQDVVE